MCLVEELVDGIHRRNLGLSNSVWSLIWPWLINTQYVFIMVAFFRQIPESLEESAMIEGCSHFQVYLRIILPLSLASMVTIGLFYAVWHWNSWFDAAMFIHDGSKLPIQNLLVYPYIQKYFVKGFMVESVKG